MRCMRHTCSPHPAAAWKGHRIKPCTPTKQPQCCFFQHAGSICPGGGRRSRAECQRRRHGLLPNGPGTDVCERISRRARLWHATGNTGFHQRMALLHVIEGQFLHKQERHPPVFGNLPCACAHARANPVTVEESRPCAALALSSHLSHMLLFTCGMPVAMQAAIILYTMAAPCKC